MFFTLIGGAFGALGAGLVAQRQLVGRVGGAMLLVVGVLPVTGLWHRFIVQLQPVIGGFRTPL